MSERKVLNKYYPPDFDPSKIPRARQPKNRQFIVRLMAPFNMKCNTCHEYIYKGKKFNARKEDVQNEDYLGENIYRFYIKCTRCLSEISFKTDPASQDYVIEAGATRNFMALKLAEEQAMREIEAEKEEERTDPMKLLENRTKASRGEIEMVETLEELRELNKRKVVVNFDEMLNQYAQQRQTEAEIQEMEDERLIRQVFGEKTEDGRIIKRLADDDSDEEIHRPLVKVLKTANPTDFMCAPPGGAKNKKVKPLVRVKSQKTRANNAMKPVAAAPVSSSAADSSSSGSSVAAPAKTLGWSLLCAY